MTPRFQLVGIDHRPFEPLFDLDDDALAALGARRRIADESPGFPCRISLEDAAAGETLLLLPFEHQPGDSPYRASGPIFVRRGVRQRRLPAGELGGYVTRRLISVRAYDAAHMMVDATVCDGTAAAQAIEQALRRADVDYLHLHNAKRGCFSCRVERA